MTISPRLRRRLALAATITALAAFAASLVLIVATLRAGGEATVDAFTLAGIALGATYAVVGWLVASRRSDNVIGWVFLGIALSQGGDSFASLASTYGLVLVPGSLPFATEWSWVAVWVWAPGFVLLATFSLLLFPDGHLPSRRWRPVSWFSLVMLALFVIPVAIASWPSRGVALTGPLDRDMGPAMEIAGTFQFIALLMAPILAAASVASVVIRFRRSNDLQRQQIKWFTAAAIPEIGFIVAGAFLTVPTLIGLLAAVLIAPLCRSRRGSRSFVTSYSTSTGSSAGPSRMRS